MADTFLFQDGQKVVFVGDSITDCGRRDSQAPFGDGYVRQTIDLITARYPERSITYWNEGISGNTVDDLHGRWEQDVLRHKPDWVSVKIGINDLHRTTPEGAFAYPPEKYEGFYRSILQDVRDHTKARLVLIDPFYISAEQTGDSGQREVLQRLPGYLEVVHRLAEEFHAINLRTHDLFQEQLKYRPAETFCPEPVHPNYAGHLVIAHGLLGKLGW